MMGRPKFDEVMIVNPSDGNFNTDQRVRLMRFHNTYPPEINGYAQPEPSGYDVGPQAYGYYAQPAQYGYFAQEVPANPPVDPTYGYYAQVDPNDGYGYFADDDPTWGYYPQENPTYGYYAQEAEPDRWEGYDYGHYEPAIYSQPGPMGYYAEDVPVGPYNQAPMGYYGEDVPVGPYNQTPMGYGYGDPEPQYESPAVGYYGGPEYSGYAREVSPPFNAGCPLPTNVNGLDDGFAGYARPATVNASCSQFTEQPGSPAVAPDTFKPLW